MALLTVLRPSSAGSAASAAATTTATTPSQQQEQQPDDEQPQQQQQQHYQDDGPSIVTATVPATAEHDDSDVDVVDHPSQPPASNDIDDDDQLLTVNSGSHGHADSSTAAQTAAKTSSDLAGLGDEDEAVVLRRIQNECYFAPGHGVVVSTAAVATVAPLSVASAVVTDQFLITSIEGQPLSSIRGGTDLNLATGTGTDIQQHLQSMFYLLRQQETLKMAVKLETARSGRTRYLVVVSRPPTCQHQTVGAADDAVASNESPPLPPPPADSHSHQCEASPHCTEAEESCLLGIDVCQDRTTVGLVLRILADTTIRLDGDGGFSVSVFGRTHIFKPVSVQAMWSALQTLHKVSARARSTNCYPGGPSHAWAAYYEARIASERSCLNEWNAMDSLESRRPPSPDALRSKPTQREETELVIKTALKEIMMSVDLDEVTSKYIRGRLEEHLDMDLGEFKSFIDEEMLIILGQMDAPTEIFDHVYLGSEWNASNLEELQKNGVGHILNVTREIDNFFPGQFNYLNVRVYDDEKTNLLKHWDRTFKYIASAHQAGSKVLVHCKMGVSRSASVVIAYAMKAFQLNFPAALRHVKHRRSCIKPNKSFLQQLETYQGMLDAMKNKEKLQRSKSETNLRSASGGGGGQSQMATSKDGRLLPGSEPTPLIQALNSYSAATGATSSSTSTLRMRRTIVSTSSSSTTTTTTRNRTGDLEHVVTVTVDHTKSDNAPAADRTGSTADHSDNSQMPAMITAQPIAAAAAAIGRQQQALQQLQQQLGQQQQLSPTQQHISRSAITRRATAYLNAATATDDAITTSTTTTTATAAASPATVDGNAVHMRQHRQALRRRPVSWSPDRQHTSKSGSSASTSPTAALARSQANTAASSSAIAAALLPKQQSQSLETLTQPDRGSGGGSGGHLGTSRLHANNNKNVLLPCSNGQTYSVSQNQVVHLQQETSSGSSSSSSVVALIVSELETSKALHHQRRHRRRRPPTEADDGAAEDSCDEDDDDDGDDGGPATAMNNALQQYNNQLVSKSHTSSVQTSATTTTTTSASHHHNLCDSPATWAPEPDTTTTTTNKTITTAYDDDPPTNNINLPLSCSNRFISAAAIHSGSGSSGSSSSGGAGKYHQQPPMRNASWGSGDTARMFFASGAGGTLPSRNSSWGSYDRTSNAGCTAMSSASTSATSSGSVTLGRRTTFSTAHAHAGHAKPYAGGNDVAWHSGTVKRTKLKLESGGGGGTAAVPVTTNTTKAVLKRRCNAGGPADATAAAVAAAAADGRSHSEELLPLSGETQQHQHQQYQHHQHHHHHHKRTISAGSGQPAPPHQRIAHTFLAQRSLDAAAAAAFTGDHRCHLGGDDDDDNADDAYADDDASASAAAIVSSHYYGNVHNLKQTFETAVAAGEKKKVKSLPSSPIAAHHSAAVEDKSSVAHILEEINVKDLVGRYEIPPSSAAQGGGQQQQQQHQYSANVGRQRPRSVFEPRQQHQQHQHHHHHHHHQHHYTKPLMLTHASVLMSKATDSGTVDFRYPNRPPPVPATATTATAMPTVKNAMLLSSTMLVAAVNSSSSSSNSNALNNNHTNHCGGVLVGGSGGGESSSASAVSTVGGGSSSSSNSSKRIMQQHGKTHPLARLGLSSARLNTATYNTM